MNLYVVTGTTQGLGAALAAAIARDSSNRLVSLSRGAEGDIPGGRLFAVDLADTVALEGAYDRVEAHLAGQSFDKAVLINNAGVVAPVGPIDQVDAVLLERNLAVNLVAPLLLMRRFLRATGGVAVRRVINISSGAGRRPIFGWGGYCTAKAGLDMASRVVAAEAEARGTGVEVVSLAPGVIDTSMQGVVRGAAVEDFVDVERFRQMKAEGALREAADVAADILRLEGLGKLKGDPVLDLRSLA